MSKVIQSSKNTPLKHMKMGDTLTSILTRQISTIRHCSIEVDRDYPICCESPRHRPFFLRNDQQQSVPSRVLIPRPTETQINVPISVGLRTDSRTALTYPVDVYKGTTVKSRVSLCIRKTSRGSGYHLRLKRACCSIFSLFTCVVSLALHTTAS